MCWHLVLFLVISTPYTLTRSFAAKTKFGGRIVHGMLTTSFVSASLAMLLGTIVLLESCFRYVSPVRVGETVRVEGVVVEKRRTDARSMLNASLAIG